MTTVSLARPLAALALLLSSGHASAAVIVDWLALRSGGTATSFVLEGDGGSAVASGQMLIDSGIAFPGYPRERIFSQAGWSTTQPLEDSSAGDSRVQGIDLRVVPQAGAANYRVEFALPAGQEFVLALGGLYRDATDATAAVLISWANGAGAVSLESTVGWTDSVNFYNTPLTWTAGSGTLSPDAGSEGNSSVAFFRLGAMPGPATLVLNIPDGYGSGTGDEITVALGALEAVPEPSSAVLAATSALVALSRRRRR